MLWWTLRQLKSKDFNTRKNAALKLGDSKNPAAIEPLVTFWHADAHNTTTRAAALESLVRLGPIAVEALVGALQDKLWWNRQDAAHALGQIGDGRAVAPLAAALRESDPNVRKAVMDALLTFGGTAVKPVINVLRLEDCGWAAANVLGLPMEFK